MRKALVIGAGNIGRGFLAEILTDSDYQITFCDVNAEILNAIEQRKQYDIVYAGTGDKKTISGYKTVNSFSEKAKYEEAVAKADLIMTAIGVNLLPRISQQLAGALSLHPRKRVLMACENAIRASSQWKQDMSGYLSDELKTKTLFVDVAVDRIVPNIRHQNGDVTVEPYKEMVVDNNVDQTIADLKGVVIAAGGLDPYISRKLFCVNATHAYIAWQGLAEGFEYIHEAIAYPPIKEAAQKLLNELTEVLVMGYDLPRQETVDYCKKTLHRFANHALQDTLERVGRGVLRKISPNERFVKPINVAIEHGLEYRQLIKGLHLAATVPVPNDPESAILLEEVKKNGLGKTLAKYTKLSEETIKKFD